MIKLSNCDYLFVLLIYCQHIVVWRVATSSFHSSSSSPVAFIAFYTTRKRLLLNYSWFQLCILRSGLLARRTRRKNETSALIVIISCKWCTGRSIATYRVYWSKTWMFVFCRTKLLRCHLRMWSGCTQCIGYTLRLVRRDECYSLILIVLGDLVLHRNDLSLTAISLFFERFSESVSA